MKKFFSAFCILAALASSVSCLKGKDEYPALVVGHLSDMTIHSDQGPDYELSSSPELEKKLKDVKRIIAQVTVTKKVSDKKYLATLLDYQPMKIDDISILSDTSDPGVFGDDLISPIAENTWFGAGYLNTLVHYYAKKNSSQSHDVYLVYDDVKSIKDTIYLSVKHQAHGDVPTFADIEKGECTNVGKYYSFKLSSHIKANPDYDKTVVKIEYDWYKFDENTQKYTAQRQHYKVLGYINRD